MIQKTAYVNVFHLINWYCYSRCLRHLHIIMRPYMESCSALMCCQSGRLLCFTNQTHVIAQRSGRELIEQMRCDWCEPEEIQYIFIQGNIHEKIKKGVFEARIRVLVVSWSRQDRHGVTKEVPTSFQSRDNEPRTLVNKSLQTRFLSLGITYSSISLSTIQILLFILFSQAKETIGSLQPQQRRHIALCLLQLKSIYRCI